MNAPAQPPRNPVAAPLFDPLAIRGAALANRIVMAPMTRCFCPQGVPGEDVAAYYRRRAEAMVGFIITEGVGVNHPSALGQAGLNEADTPIFYGADALAGWKRVVDEVHAAGGRIAPQLWHQGVMRQPGSGPFPEAESMRPSGIWGPFGGHRSIHPDYVEATFAPTRAMTEEDIEDVIAAYVAAAADAAALGFDGIALHGAHGYMIDSFLWEHTNVRTDSWGGDIARRTRFAAEIVRRIRQAIGEELPIFFRFSQWKQQDYNACIARTPAELEQVLGPLADAGVDVFDASNRLFNKPAFEGSPMSLAGWARKVTGKHAMAVGQVGLNKEFYEDRNGNISSAIDNTAEVVAGLERGEYDLVGVGRGLLNDPEWVRKLWRGEPQLPYDVGNLQRLT